MDFVSSQSERLEKAMGILGYEFQDTSLLLTAITHPSAVEGRSIELSYERLEFLGDSILGFIIAQEAFNRYPDLNEGGLTRIKVSLVSGSTLSEISSELGFENIIIFGQSEQGTGKRGLNSALENVYEACVAALYLDGGMEPADAFVKRTLAQRMSRELAVKPENPKSALQERLQEEGITPTYELIETQGPPHNRTFIAAVFAGVQDLARGVGRTKKEAESNAANVALQMLDSEREEFEATDPKVRKENEKMAIKQALQAEKDRKLDAQTQKKEQAKAEKERKEQERAAERARKAQKRRRKDNKEAQ